MQFQTKQLARWVNTRTYRGAGSASWRSLLMLTDLIITEGPGLHELYMGTLTEIVMY